MKRIPIELTKFLDDAYLKKNIMRLVDYIDIECNRNMEECNVDLEVLHEIEQLFYKRPWIIQNMNIRRRFSANLDLLSLLEQDIEQFWYASMLLDKNMISKVDMKFFLTLVSTECPHILEKIFINMDMSEFTYDMLEKIETRLDSSTDIDKLLKDATNRFVDVKLDEVEFSLRGDAFRVEDMEKVFTEILSVIQGFPFSDITSSRLFLLCDQLVNQDGENFPLFKESKYLYQVLQEIMTITATNYHARFKDKILNSQLDLEIGELALVPYTFNFSDRLFASKDLPVITLDSIDSPDLDSAFSLRREGDYYLFYVHITDAPCFLDKNKKISKAAFYQGNSIYLRADKGQRQFNMMPKELAYASLSMKKNKNKACVKPAITIGSVIDANGQICAQKINRSNVVIEDNLTAADADIILNKKYPTTSTEEMIFLLSKVCSKVSQNSNHPHLKKLNQANVFDLIAFPSVFVNCLATDLADFGIYRSNGLYSTKPSELKYMRVGAPLRRYADNINLAILLQQQGIYSFNDTDFRYLEGHLDAVVEHLNEREQLASFVDKNSQFVKKYYKVKSIKNKKD